MTFSYQFWQKCHCVHIEEKRLIVKIEPILLGEEKAVRLVLHRTSSDNKSVCGELCRKIIKTEKIDLQNKWQEYANTIVSQYETTGCRL